MRGSNCFILPMSLLVNIILSIIVIVSPKNKEMEWWCLSPLGIQWVVEWWRITDMVNRGFKDNCVPLFELCHCSYYSTCHIARQFGDHQGAPSDNGSFHTLAFTDRILGRIRESWLWRRVTKGICFPQFLHPTLRYKKWLKVDMKWVPIDEKAYKWSNKRKRTDWLPWYALKFSFLHFMILMSFILNLIKDWKVSNLLWKQFITF